MRTQAEANLAALIESTEDHVWSVDLDYRITVFNRAFQRYVEKAFGTRAVVGMGLGDLFSRERAGIWPPFFERAVAEGPFRIKHALLDGHILEMAFNPIVADGKVTGVSVFGRDITERQTVEESRGLLASIVESSEDAIHCVGLDGTVIIWNRGAEMLFGYAGEEIIGKSITVLAPPGRNAEVPEMLGQIGRGSHVSPFNTVLRSKDGRDVEVSLSISPIRSLAGEVVGASAIARDISALRKADEAQTLLAAIVASSGDAIHIINLDGTVGSWNSAAEKLSGYTRDEIVGKMASILAPPGAAQMMQRDLKAIEAGSTISPFDTVLRRKDGSTIDASVSLSQIRNVAGQVVAASAVVRDISERKRFERALQEAEKKYRDIFDGAFEGMFQTSPDAAPLTANRALAKMLGYESLDDLRSAGGSLFEEVWADQNDRHRFLQQVEEHGAVRDFECPLKRKDGTVLWGSVNCRIVNGAAGEVPHFEGFIEDITERKRGVEALRESAESLGEAQRAGALGSYVLDVPSGIWTGSAVLDEIFGIDKEYVRTVETWVDLIHPEDRAGMLAYFEGEVVGQRKPFNREYRTVRQTDKAERWVHGMGRLDFDVQGHPLKMRGVIKDVTERKVAEIQLTHSEERYRQTFEQASVGIVHTSFDGRLLRCNKRFAEIIGYPVDAIEGLTIQEITAPEDLDASLRKLEELRTFSSAGRSFEKRYVRQDGSLTWVRVSASTQFDSRGKALHYISVVEDINARKEAEEHLAAAQHALEASETRYRTAFQTSPDGIWITDLEQGEYIDANKAFLDLIGYALEETIGHTSTELNLWVEAGARQKRVEMLRKAKSFRNLDTQFRKKNGEIIWVELSSSVIDIEGVFCVLSVARDVSEAKVAKERVAAAQAAQRKSEDRYRTAFQTSPNSVTLNGLDDGMYFDVNGMFIETMGFSREEVVGRTLTELNIWEDAADREAVSKALRESSIFQGEVRFRKKNGDILWGRMSASLFEHEGVPTVLSVTQDITDAKAAAERLAASQAALLRSEERYRTAFQTSLDAVNINRLDDGTYLECNKAFLDIFGYARNEVLGKTSLELQVWNDPRDRVSFIEILRQNSSCRDMEARFRKKNGDLVWGLMSASLIELDGMSCVLSVTRDITEAKAAEEKIRSLAFYDPLTGLPNRRLLLDRLRQLIASTANNERMHALLFIDLDHFKTLNDTLGHEIGDLQLQEVARRLAGCVRETDTVARLGGDEFVAMLEEVGDTTEVAKEQAKAIAEKILYAISQPYLIADRECRSTASLGIAVFGDRKQTADEILQQADIAMDEAKSGGTDTLRFFSPALQSAVNYRAELEDDLRQAIKTNQFVLHYQPQLECELLIGAEALIRWNHPTRGLMPPGDFIPLAEETGLILPMGDWVLEKACKQIAAWAHQEEPAYISLSVNISARQFRQPDFVAKVLAALDRTGADPENLELELTESMLVDSIEEVICKMTELKAHGLRFSLDDFGTGYSSLAYLKRLPLDQLKIDRSFVQDILVDASSGAIAQTIISLSRAMGLPVIAEGVESEEQRDYLTRLGCHSFQGYLFSRPLPLEEFERLWMRPREHAVHAPVKR